MTIKGNQSEIAVAEVVGFIIILGIMMTGIALVTLYGYPALVKEQANANIKNMERNMIVLQNDVKALAYKGVPYKETMIQIGDGTLLVKPSNSDTKSFNISDYGTFKPGELQFKASAENVVIALQNGAVVKSYWAQGGSVMISEPRWYVDTDLSGTKTFVISLINITADDDLAKSGMANVQLHITNSTTSLPITPGSGDVSVTYNDLDNDYRTAWGNYFQYDLNMVKDPFTNTYTMHNVDTLIVKTYDIKVLGI
jgi:hypothetical protein